MGHPSAQDPHASHEAGNRKVPASHGEHYRHLAIMALLSFLSMYVLMYAMVDVVGNVHMNLNQVYMAGLMTAPMVAIELWLMRTMYPDRRRNGVILAASAVALLGFYFLLRGQVGITDAQFLRSMIPHHGAAILMCEQAPVDAPDILDLCDRIVTGQQAEIDQMKALLGQDE